ncbi:MAG TPA: response regulator, partial [Gemmatimonadaceae bacterium]
MIAEPRPTILIADDQLDVLEALRLMLKAEGFQIETARSVAAILAVVETRDLDAVIMDLNYTRDTTSGREGLDLIPKITALEPNLP